MSFINDESGRAQGRGEGQGLRLEVVRAVRQYLSLAGQHLAHGAGRQAIGPSFEFAALLADAPGAGSQIAGSIGIVHTDD